MTKQKNVLNVYVNSKGTNQPALLLNLFVHLVLSSKFYGSQCFWKRQANEPTDCMEANANIKPNALYTFMNMDASH